MKKLITTKISLLLFCAACFVSTNVMAQAFWSEDFSGGDIPAGWTNEDASGNNAIWTWCGDATTPGNGCPSIWDDGLNAQIPFAAATADNGFVTVDSDAAGNITHLSQLTTSSISCMGHDTVFLKFEAHIGVFTIPAETGALVRVSNDGGANWTDFTAFPGLLTGSPDPGVSRWSLNPQFVVLDISSVAAEQPDVLIQWQWEGNFEYQWSIDDVILTEVDPTPPIPAHDMQANDNFYAIPFDAITPASQLQEIYFLCDIENVGGETQTNVNLNVTIVDDADGSVVHTDDLFYGDIMPDSLAENQLFPGTYTPSTDITTYTGTYVVTADSTDLVPGNDSVSYQFAVSEGSFSKALTWTRDIIPAAGNWDDGEPHGWAYGNYYYVPNGDGFMATTADFGITNAEELAGRSVTVWLYSWTDTNADGNADPDERTPVGFNIYVIEGTEEPGSLQSVELLGFPDDTAPVLLDNGGQYILMVEYTPPDDVDMALLASDANDYNATVFITEPDDIDTPELEGLSQGPARYGSFLGINADLSVEPYSSVGFGRDFTPIVILNISPVTGTENTLAAENVVEIFPNPANDILNLNIDLTDRFENAQVRIVDVTGKVLFEKTYTDVQNDSYIYDLSRFSAGAYILHFVTDEGTRTERFVIQR